MSSGTLNVVEGGFYKGERWQNFGRVVHNAQKQANKFGELKKVDSQSDNETKCVLQSSDFYSLIPPMKTYIVVLMNKEKTHCAAIMLNFTAANVDDAEYIIRTYLEKANIK